MTAPQPEKTGPRPRSERSSMILRATRRPFVPGVREPVQLPDNKIQLPSPDPLPGQPPVVNWLNMLLPPALIMAAMGVMVLVNPNASMMMIIPSIMMSLGFPLANIFSLRSQKKKYAQNVAEREARYRRQLEQERHRLGVLAQEQRARMEQLYPRARAALDLALAKGAKSRLWFRRPQDSDFLALRAGVGTQPASFTVLLPNAVDRMDPLNALPPEVQNDFRELQDLPFAVDLKRTGSLAIVGRDDKATNSMALRLALDLIVHHSPQDLELVLLTDQEDWAARWDWLKWAPHTQALAPDSSVRRIAFRMGTVSDTLEWLVDTYRQRRDERSHAFAAAETTRAALVVFLDDKGKLRQLPSLAPLVEHGHEVGIYLIFLSERFLPRVRARLDVSDQGAFRYVETWEGGRTQRGRAEAVERSEIEAAARALATLELLGEKNTVSIPASLRLFQLLELPSLDSEVIKANWNLPRSDRELLQFPIGVRASRDGLEPLLLNLLPAERGGMDAYHTILIGTTGSGKSEFMKSLVMAAAFKYSPRLLNFFFLDFKAGAAFGLFGKLPHVVGIVTSIDKPEIVERGLDAVKNEIERRQEKFAQAGVKDIWSYNQQRSSQPMPHLVLLLDEFTKGLQDIPRLKELLDLLVRQGRSLGMYLILANQDVNSAVDSLLNNVGWRIALKVARQEEMHIVDKTLKPTNRAGHGYLRSSSGDIYEFQAAYAGLPLLEFSSEQEEDFEVLQVEADGATRVLYKYTGHPSVEVSRGPAAPKEEEHLIGVMRQATQELELESSRPIYLEPLPAEIPLGSLLRTQQSSGELYRSFDSGGWSQPLAPGERLFAPLGCVDFPRECLQAPLQISFNEQDGHLWIAGSPGSGKAASLTTLLASLALTHTPEEVNFYILEFGAGGLRRFESLPHTGAVIRLPEAERLERLLNFLDDEMNRRTMLGDDAPPGSEATRPYEPLRAAALSRQADIFLVINNFAELRTSYPDHIERISRYVRDGKSAGIHLIITTNRGSELPRMISNNIARRLVLQMASRDEYLDITQRMVSPLSERASGRGFWVSDGVAECQVAAARLQPAGEGTGSGSQEMDREMQELLAAMGRLWQGGRPHSVGVAPTSASLESITAWEKPAQGAVLLPVGVSYDSLDPLWVDPLDGVPQWLVLGAKQRGKSNFLASLAESLLRQDGEGWQLLAYTLRRSPPLASLAARRPALALRQQQEEVLEDCQALVARLKSELLLERPLMLLIDDLDAAYEQGREALRNAFEALAPLVRDRSDIFLAASGSMENLRNGMATTMVRMLKQSNTGIAFSNDAMVLEWLGVQPQFVMPYRKMDFPAGRGIFVSKKPALVQAYLCA